MKTKLAILCLPVLLGACSAVPDDARPVSYRMEPVQVSGTTMYAAPDSAVRTPEALKSYAVGAYVDPNNRRIRHDPHHVTRIEQDPAWNLRPNRAEDLATGPATSVQDAAAVNSPLTAEIEQELGKQKQLTSILVEQNRAMSEQMEVMKVQAEGLEELKKENMALKQTLSTTQTRVEELSRKVGISPEPAADGKSAPSSGTQEKKSWFKLW